MDKSNIALALITVLLSVYIGVELLLSRMRHSRTRRRHGQADVNPKRSNSWI